MPGFCPWQNPWGKKRWRRGQRPGGGRGCCGPGLAVPCSCGFSPSPTPSLCGLAHGHPEAGEVGSSGRGLRALSTACAGPAGPRPRRGGPACPRAARCSLCTRLPPPLTRPVSPALPLTPPLLRSIPLQAGVPAPAVRGGVARSRRGSSFRWSQERPEGLPLGRLSPGSLVAAVQQPSWEPLILWKERAGRGRKGRPCSVCCSAPRPAL